MARAMSVTTAVRKKYKKLKWSEEWQAAFDNPQMDGIWCVWGNSGSGKTSFLLELCKELSRFGRVVYNSLEEYDRDTFQQALLRHNIASFSRRILITKENAVEMVERMSKQKAPYAIVMDSVQYLQWRLKNYFDFKEKMKGKLVIVVSHAEGKKPEGRVADKIKYDADLKIWIEGYRAISQGRYIGKNGGVFTIWEEGANIYWGKKNDN